MLHRQVLPLGSFGTNCVILWQDGKSECWLVDPGQEAQVIIDFLGEKSLTPALIALTHAHFDHIGAIKGLIEKWPQLPVHISAAEGAVLTSPLNEYPPEYPRAPVPPTLVKDLADGFVLSGGGISAEVLAIPGHTPGSVGFYFAAERLLLSGDTLFAGSCGRTDLPGGSMRAMENSLKRLSTLEMETQVIAGHGRATTIGAELSTNPFMAR